MEEILAMEHITKTYPGVKALDDVSISFIQGEVHAVMGENGAGKSTLMKILNGMIPADSGDIRFHGEKVAIRNPRDARALGIAMIHQELNPIKDLTVAENMFVGRYPQKGCFVDWSTMYDECRKLFEHWKVDFDPKQKVRTLSTAETQMLEILKAISYDAKLIIMDEPTSAITEREVQKLFSFIEELKGKGITIIIITHKIDEVFHVADRVSVLRDGKYIGTSAIQELDHDKLISMMVGREISNVHPPRDYQGGEIVLKVEHLQCGKKVRDVTFEVHKGEILGFAGIVGAGRTETLRCLFGLDHAEQGSVSMGGKEISIRQPRDAIKNGIAMVTENRKEDGLVLCRSIMENTVLPSTYMNAKNGILQKRTESDIATEMCRKLRVKTPSYEKIVNQLSGGNQWVKAWVVGHLQLGETTSLFPGFLELMRVHNYGAAWSSFAGQKWLLLGVTGVILAAVLWVLARRIVRHPLGICACCLILSGGIGNIIDRFRLGYVVDMLHFQFWPSYPTFNVADVCIVSGAILGAIYYVLIYEKHDRRKTDGASDPANGQ